MKKFNSLLSYSYLNSSSTISILTINGHNTNFKLTTGTSIFYNTGNVGIFSSTPEQSCDVIGNIKANN